MKQVKIVFLFLFLLLTQSSWAQDLIILHPNRDTLHVKVLQIAAREVYYTTSDSQSRFDPKQIKTDLVARIVYANGTVIRLMEGQTIEANFLGNRNFAIKIDPFIPLYGSTYLAIESSLAARRSMEIGIGVIGAGLAQDTYLNRKGAFARFAYTFYLTTFRPKLILKQHLLSGWYLRPSIIANYFELNEVFFNTSAYQYINGQSKYTIRNMDKRFARGSAGVLLSLGKQWVFKNRISLDLSYGLGVGYGYQKVINETISYTEYLGYGWQDKIVEVYDVGAGTGIHINHNNKFAFAMEGGVRMGFLIHCNKKAKAF